MKSPYTHNWFAGVQREIPLGIVAEVNYLGSAGRQLHNAYNVNRFVGDCSTAVLRRDSTRASPGITMVTSNSRRELSRRHAPAAANFSQGYMLQGAYTFGKAMNDADQAVGSTAFQDTADIGADYAIAGYDVRHKLALVGLWEMPFFKEQPGLAHKVLSGWQLAGSAIMQTGMPINVTNGAAFPSGDYNADGSGGDRPNAPASRREDERLEPGGIPRRHLQGCGLPGARRSGRTAISLATPTAGLGYADVSLSLSKRFNVTRRCNTEFRVDAFNAFNRVNLSDPNMDLSNTNFGKVHVAAEHPRDSAGGAGAVLIGQSFFGRQPLPLDENRRSRRPGPSCSLHGGETDGTMTERSGRRGRDSRAAPGRRGDRCRK